MQRLSKRCLARCARRSRRWTGRIGCTRRRIRRSRCASRYDAERCTSTRKAVVRLWRGRCPVSGVPRHVRCGRVVCVRSHKRLRPKIQHKHVLTNHNTPAGPKTTYNSHRAATAAADQPPRRARRPVVALHAIRRVQSRAHLTHTHTPCHPPVRPRHHAPHGRARRPPVPPPLPSAAARTR